MVRVWSLSVMILSLIELKPSKDFADFLSKMKPTPCTPCSLFPSSLPEYTNDVAIIGNETALVEPHCH